ncbi:hypothetical protein BDZ90DRAFT_280764 [Jaminaea rosea]|uniref:Uncharacterized protein n=1 Tax=Jaminaea rosea TaxID=1569628 RepID=A0A316UPG0_9BASI|nr:hypothetical protein BDZ90DRAFT_280764 [Jaminaea rosea]PWN26231.1 hypothetical protein BDZ90DRAFT_280764 [Jaminaea rosea]
MTTLRPPLHATTRSFEVAGPLSETSALDEEHRRLAGHDLERDDFKGLEPINIACASNFAVEAFVAAYCRTSRGAQEYNHRLNERLGAPPPHIIGLNGTTCLPTHLATVTHAGGCMRTDQQTAIERKELAEKMMAGGVAMTLVSNKGAGAREGNLNLYAPRWFVDNGHHKIPLPPVTCDRLQAEGPLPDRSSALIKIVPRHASSINAMGAFEDVLWLKVWAIQIEVRGRVATMEWPYFPTVSVPASAFIASAKAGTGHPSLEVIATPDTSGLTPARDWPISALRADRPAEWSRERDVQTISLALGTLRASVWKQAQKTSEDT